MGEKEDRLGEKWEMMREGWREWVRLGRRGRWWGRCGGEVGETWEMVGEK